ncbi:hypothetical protein ACJX0J_009721, partial [Zea mays]
YDHLEFLMFLNFAPFFCFLTDKDIMSLPVWAIVSSLFRHTFVSSALIAERESHIECSLFSLPSLIHVGWLMFFWAKGISKEETRQLALYNFCLRHTKHTWWTICYLWYLSYIAFTCLSLQEVFPSHNAGDYPLQGRHIEIRHNDYDRDVFSSLVQICVVNMFFFI